MLEKLLEKLLKKNVGKSFDKKTFGKINHKTYILISVTLISVTLFLPV